MVLATFAVSLLAQAGDDPDEDWAEAFGWIQAGQELSDAGLAPLAIGSYMEAHRKLSALRHQHPGFQVEVIAFRIEQLEKDIRQLGSDEASRDRTLIVKFVDFAESFDQGQQMRFCGEFLPALRVLETAKALIDEIIEVDPERHRSAVATHYELLEGSLAWLDEQINREERERMRTVAAVTSQPDEWGTTEFVKEEDLPVSGDIELVASALFPITMMMGGREEQEGMVEITDVPLNLLEEKPEIETRPIPKPAFRFSSEKDGESSDPAE